MVDIITRTKSTFRIEIRDLKTGKTKTISLSNHKDTTLEELKDMIIKSINIVH